MKLLKWLFWDTWGNRIDWFKTFIVCLITLFVSGIILACVLGCGCNDDYQSLRFKNDIDYSHPYMHIYYSGRYHDDRNEEVVYFKKGIIPDDNYKPINQ